MAKNKSGSAVAAPTASHFQERPPTKRTAVMIKRMSTEVPKSGCTRISATQTRMGAIAGRMDCNKSWLAKFHAQLVAAAKIQKPCQIKNYGEFGKFRWLNAERAERDPTVGGVGLIKKKCADEQEDDRAEHCIHDCGFAKSMVIEFH